MKFGVNYTPRRGWFHSWLDLDLGMVREDFSQIRELGLDHVRIFPLWPLLQPSMGRVRPSAVADVVKVVEIAGECGLEASVDALQGHLSSFDFLPSWVQTWHHRNLFSDPDVVRSQAMVVRELAQALEPLDNCTGMCVGNEFLQFAAERHPDQSVIDSPTAAGWLDTLLAEAGAKFPRGRHVFSFDDDLFFDSTHPFTPKLSGEYGDLTTVHAWVFGHVGKKYGPNSPQLAAFPRYLCEIARGWQGDNPLPLWLQEVGAPMNYLDGQSAPRFVEEVCDSLCDPLLPGLEAITWWCSYDVNRDFEDFPELEYSLGLFDSEGNLKPVGQAFAQAANKYRSLEPIASQSPVPQSSMEVTLREDGADRHTVAADSDFFAQWFEEFQKGNVMSISINRC
ncbi:hypothetical protein KRX54_07285 [Actinomycetaceae bacterium TAE3-ERU4]|nr:hypothetical protein [Actinomycetaceae bacterium TAE3-ERU4]